MNSYNYDEILEMIKSLSNSAKKKLILDISILINSSLNKNDSELICPHCHNKYIVKNGKNKNVQRYLCKACKRSFVSTTNTPKLDGFVMPRKPHKRGGQARFKGISKEKVCVSTKYLANYLALFKYIFTNIEESPLLIKGEHPYKNTNFKGRPPIFK